MAIGRSENGRIERQKILDFMHKMQRAVSCREICEAVKQTRVSTISRLGQMREHREVDAVEGKVGNTPTLFYSPLVTTTAPIYTPVRAADKAKAPGAGAPLGLGVVTVRRPGYVSHNGMNRDRPLPSQGGQGAVRGPRTATYLEQNV